MKDLSEFLKHSIFINEPQSIYHSLHSSSFSSLYTRMNKSTKTSSPSSSSPSSPPSSSFKTIQFSFILILISIILYYYYDSSSSSPSSSLSTLILTTTSALFHRQQQQQERMDKFKKVYEDLVTDIEFLVDMTCHRCVTAIDEAIKKNLPRSTLKKASVEDQNIIVESRGDLSIDVLETIRSTGRTAAISGFGNKSSAAVCAMGIFEGWEKGCGGAGGVGVKGVNGIFRLIDVSAPDQHNHDDDDDDDHHHHHHNSNNNDEHTTNNQDKHTILFEGRITGLENNIKHSLVIHQAGDLSRGCDSVGKPYVYNNNNNNRQNSEEDGVVGVTYSKDGKVEFRVTNDQYDIWDLIGRSLVLHSHKEDEKDKRIACGIITRAASIGQNKKKVCPCDPKQPSSPQDIDSSSKL